MEHRFFFLGARLIVLLLIDDREAGGSNFAV